MGLPAKIKPVILLIQPLALSEQPQSANNVKSAITKNNSFGYTISNELFASQSWYFRNALVRANYFNREKGITPTDKYLVAFMRNLILGEHNELRNRYLHVDYPVQSEETGDSKSKICTLNCTLEELAVLRLLKADSKATQEQLAEQIHRSPRTVKTITSRLTEKGYLARRNGKRDGWWEVLIDVPEAQCFRSFCPPVILRNFILRRSRRI